jgi:hypothetical protein
VKRILIGFAVLLMFSGCSKFEFDITPPEELQHWDVVKVEGPTESPIYQELMIKVFYPRSSGCDVVSELVSDRKGKEIYVKAFGYTVTEAGCTLAAVPGTIYFTFFPEKKGNYVIKFVNRDKSVISHSVHII